MHEGQRGTEREKEKKVERKGKQARIKPIER